MSVVTSRTIIGGKGGGSQYDPQIGAASAELSRVAGKAQDFSEKYYNEVITPLLKDQNASSKETQGKLNNLYDLNAEQTKLSMDRYKSRGIPAEDRYYGMVDQYSEPEEMERQATAAKGDFETAEQGQRQAFMRQQASLGVDPSSPAAQAAMADMAVMGAATQAGAMNRARDAARTLGMQLKSDAANFGRGGTSQALAFGQNASGNATGAFGVANQALNSGMQAGNSVMQGYNTAMQGYTSQMSNWTQMGKADLEAQSQGGFGALVGQLGSAAIRKIPSDRRLKVNVEHIGITQSGLNVYEFDYIWGGERQTGLMAQEVQHVIPEAVSVGPGGYMLVDYSKVL